jgi:hypothetical protein
VRAHRSWHSRDDARTTLNAAPAHQRRLHAIDFRARERVHHQLCSLETSDSLLRRRTSVFRAAKIQRRSLAAREHHMNRLRWTFAAVTITTFVACNAPDATTALTRVNNRLSAHDPDVSGKPDLIVDVPTLGSSWVIYNETIPPGCTAEEGDVTPGDHRTLRFSVNTPNVGTADVVVGDPNEHFDPNGDGNPSDSDGLFEFATCHAHYHFRHYATYELLPIGADGSPGAPIIAAKRGFCMIDVVPYKSDASSPRAWVYRSCGRPAIGGLPGIAGNQGISTGWADQYFKHLAGQFFVVDDVPGGSYMIRIVVNPPFVAQSGEPCPHLDPAGLCHMLEESNYANNVGEVRITLPSVRPGKQGWGPGGGTELPADLYDVDPDAFKMGEKGRHQHTK